MKKILFLCILFIGMISNLQSQEINFGTGFGTGAFYLVESNDSSVNLDYTRNISLYSEISYKKKGSYFGLKLKLQYLNSDIKGDDWTQFMSTIDGNISSFSSFLLLEHLNQNKKWNFGYNFGLGYTKERLQKYLHLTNTENIIEKNYASLSLGGIIDFKLNQKLSLQLSPSLQWADPISSIKTSYNWDIAGEDLHFLVQFGINYRLN
ncbi:hypothetical protein [Aureivirga sp. CE67]|uniref:hypothetical protein n=1 Tax=Aureivirga sp. CE67 TaxID=1788983 RepID=UPI0018CBBAFC|nr:hypothetical protein [Aureivirga sp. CE67]